MYEDRPSSGGFAKGLVTGIVATVIAAIIFVAVYLNSLSGGAITLESVSKLGKIDKLIEENFYEPVDRNALIEGMYKGLVQGLSDKYSIYFTKEEAVKADEATTGNFVGIGLWSQSEVMSPKSSSRRSMRILPLRKPESFGVTFL